MTSNTSKEHACNGNNQEKPPLLSSSSASKSTISSNSTTKNSCSCYPDVDLQSSPPVISSNQILLLGSLAFTLAWLWSPLILLVTVALSHLIPLCVRENDGPTRRRKLWSEMEFRAGVESVPVEGGGRMLVLKSDLQDRKSPKKGEKEVKLVEGGESGTKRASSELLRRVLVPHKDVIVEEKYWVNSRGMCLLTSIMTPKPSASKDNDKHQPQPPYIHNDIDAVICFCHGFIDNGSFVKRLEYQRLVRAHYHQNNKPKRVAVISIEIEGHGRSDGLLGYIPCWENVIQDCSNCFQQICTSRFPNAKKRFLMGESMGGAVVFDTYLDKPKFWSGAILVAPMCKISEKMMPPTVVVEFLRKLLGPMGTERALGFLPLAPAADATMLSFKYAERRNLASHASSFYGGRKPRLTTARELLLTSRRISDTLKRFDAPFLVLHGLDDKVTDPLLSRGLYDESTSKDKEIKLYPGMWHTLTSGEPPENIDRVFQDVISWIENRI